MGQPQDPKIRKWMQAAERGDLGAVIAFLETGIDINAGDPINTTALMRAVRGGHVGLIGVLLDRGASLSPRNTLGYTALTVALIRSRSWRAVWRVTQPDRRPLEL